MYIFNAFYTFTDTYDILRYMIRLDYLSNHNNVAYAIIQLHTSNNHPSLLPQHKDDLLIKRTCTIADFVNSQYKNRKKKTIAYKTVYQHYQFFLREHYYNNEDMFSKSEYSKIQKEYNQINMPLHRQLREQENKYHEAVSTGFISPEQIDQAHRYIMSYMFKRGKFQIYDIPLSTAVKVIGLSYRQSKLCFLTEVVRTTIEHHEKVEEVFSRVFVEKILSKNIFYTEP